MSDRLVAVGFSVMMSVYFLKLLDFQNVFLGRPGWGLLLFCVLAAGAVWGLFIPTYNWLLQKLGVPA